MSDGSKIQWTQATWNPVTGCTKVSAGCKHCYAERDWARLSAAPHTVYACRAFTDVQCHPQRLGQPLKWTKPRGVFVNSMSDLFHPDVRDSFIDEVFAVMALAPQHTFQVLTKRPERMRDYLSDLEGRAYSLDEVESARLADHRVRCEDDPWGTAAHHAMTARLEKGLGNITRMRNGAPLPNVWLGVSVEDQATADERIPLLLDTPAAVRWLSMEPLLGPVDLNATPPRPGSIPVNGATYDDIRGCLPKWQSYPMRAKLADGVDWVVVGGESGPKARPMHLSWARSIVRQCQAASVPVFVKQLGARPRDEAPGLPELPVAIRDRKGADMADWPVSLRVQEYPEERA